MYVKNNWPTILKKAWSIRFISLSLIFSTLEIMLPIFAHNMRDSAFTILSILAMVAAFVARIVAQKDIK